MNTTIMVHGVEDSKAVWLSTGEDSTVNVKFMCVDADVTLFFEDKDSARRCLIKALSAVENAQCKI